MSEEAFGKKDALINAVLSETRTLVGSLENRSARWRQHCDQARTNG
jgi:hypothetical protein